MVTSTDLTLPHCGLVGESLQRAPVIWVVYNLNATMDDVRMQGPTGSSHSKERVFTVICLLVIQRDEENHSHYQI